MRYAFARLSRWDLGAFRLLGPGLGNLLFPWARMVVASRKHGYVKLWPTWPQLKIGTILRRERDTRFYTELFDNPGDYIDGFEKTWVRFRSHQCSEERQVHPSLGPANEVVVFEGLKDLFTPLKSQRKVVREELLRLSRPEHKLGISHDFSNSLTVHLRLGDDFSPPNDALLRAGTRNVRLPIPWVIDVIARLRQECGPGLTVWVFSDGTDEQLGSILRIPNTYRLHFGSALADMLAMSSSNALIVSSTFSMWASYLGAVPSIYYPGMKTQELVNSESEIEYDSGHIIPVTFLRSLVKD